jgi:tol-pal system protein YbgF
MRTFVAASLVVFCVACASSSPDDAVVSSTPVPQAPAEDPRVTEMQTQMTELLERLDVLNDRIARMEAAPVSAPAPAAPRVAAPAVVPSAPAAPQAALVGAKIADDYRNAIMLYGRSRVADARRAFQAVFDADPTGDLADNALFWIGETYFGAGDYSNAMRYYARVTNEFGDQNKAPDALFKTGLSQARTGDLSLARKTFQEVIARYPYSTPAASAKHELERIKY